MVIRILATILYNATTTVVISIPVDKLSIIYMNGTDMEEVNRLGLCPSS